MNVTVKKEKTPPEITDPRYENKWLEQMQGISLEIEKLLDAAMTASDLNDPQDHFSLIEMAQDRASRLYDALDPVEAPKSS